MGRYISGVSGSSGSTPAGTTFNMPAGEDVAANNLILAGEDGYAYRANPLLTLAQLNNNTVGLTSVAAFTNLGGNTNYGLGDVPQQNIVTFPTGEVVVAYSGNGTTSNYDVNVKIKNITLGDTVIPAAISTASTGVNAIGVEKLSTSAFVLWWQESVTLKFAIYNKNGAVIKAATAGPATNGMGRQYAMCRALPNGDFVFFYRFTDGSARFTRYNSAGTIQGSEVTVLAGAISADKVNVIPLAAGGFVCQFWKGSTGAWQFARYDATGTIVGSLIAAPSSGSAPGVGNLDQMGAELADGTLAVMRRSSTNNWFVDLYGPTNTLLTSIDLGSNTSNGYQGSILATPYGFITLFTDSGSNYYLRRFLTSGAQINVEVQIAAGVGGATSPVCALTLAIVATGFAALATNTGATSVQALFAFSPDGTLRGSTVILKASSTDGIYGPCMALFGNLAIVGLRQTSPTVQSPKVAAYNTSRTSIFGVAQVSVSKGSSATVATVGSYSLTDAYSSGGAFDVRTNTAPGNRGTVAGASALLLGTSV